MGLRVVPVTWRQAAKFITAWHRHHAPPQGLRLCIGVADDEHTLRGVAVVGRPIARLQQDGVTAEVTRVCTDGAMNACSLLYGAAARNMREQGYRRVLTYTQEGESGASLRAAGWTHVADLPPCDGWDRPGRSRRPTGNEQVPRFLWQKIVNPDAQPVTSASNPPGALAAGQLHLW